MALPGDDTGNRSLANRNQERDIEIIVLGVKVLSNSF